MGLGVDRNNPKTFGTTVYGLTHPIMKILQNITKVVLICICNVHFDAMNIFFFFKVKTGY